MKRNFHAPKWVSDAIFYQIFPDRFANGVKSNDPENVQLWESEPTGDGRMGGDLQGVRKHLDYLTDLGVNAIYFNPLFASCSNHGYDTSDYETIDSRFGTNETFKKLMDEAHQKQIRVILDGVFPHVGTENAWFLDVVKNGEKSKYKDWFKIQGFPLSHNSEPHNYESWDGSGWMPLLNHDNPAVREYLLKIGAKWIQEYGVDGWRLDSAERPPHEFWKAFRKAVKAVSPEAYLVGEIWDDAHEWLKGDEFDAVMNYRWRGATYTFLAQNEMTPTDFDNTLAGIRDSYPPGMLHIMFNMLSSHDAERLADRCKDNMLIVGQCVLFQMAYPGTPCVYYGDEIGLRGDTDPLNRGAMIWDKSRWNGGLRDFHKKLIRLRKENAVLRHGDYQTVLLHDANRLFGFKREFEDQAILALFNNSDSPQCAEIALDAIGAEPYSDWLDSGADIAVVGKNLTVSLPPRGLALLGRK